MGIREEKWDIFRGIAILLVVTGHLVEGNTAIWNLIYVVHIPIFFIISGYFAFYSLKKYSFKENQIKKAKTLLLPWLMWSAVAVVMNCLKEVVAGTFSLGYLTQKIVQVYITSMSIWFLWALWLIFLLFTIAHYGVKWIYNRKAEKSEKAKRAEKAENDDKTAIIFPIVFCVLIFLIPNVSIMTLNKIKLNAVWFLVGYLLNYVNIDGRACKSIAKVGILYIPLYYVVFHVLISAGEFFAYYNLNFEGMEFGRGVFVSIVSIVYTVIGVAFVWGYVVPLIKILRLNRLFSGIGNYTLEIYTIHMMFVAYVVLVPSFISQNEIVENYLYMPLYALLICMFVKVVCEKLLHKIPVYNWVMLGKW